MERDSSKIIGSRVNSGAFLYQWGPLVCSHLIQGDCLEACKAHGCVNLCTTSAESPKMHLSQAHTRYQNAIHFVPSTSQCQQHSILAFHTCTVGNEVRSNAGVPRTVLSSRRRVIEDLVLRSSLLVVGGPPAGMLKDLEGRFGTGMLREWLKATFFCGVGLSAGCSSKPPKSCIHNSTLSVVG